MRDHKKLKAFHLADALTLQVYKATYSFPAEERFGLSSQMRRSAASVPYNIVEGSALNSKAEYLQYLNRAYASAPELEYQPSLAVRLGYLSSQNYDTLNAASAEVCRVLNALIRSLRD